ncbi:hypothetical protein BU25DRAFT_407789, partial [Macroventuria anomochaeta]
MLLASAMLLQLLQVGTSAETQEMMLILVGAPAAAFRATTSNCHPSYFPPGHNLKLNLVVETVDLSSCWTTELLLRLKCPNIRGGWYFLCTSLTRQAYFVHFKYQKDGVND